MLTIVFMLLELNSCFYAFGSYFVFELLVFPKLLESNKRLNFKMYSDVRDGFICRQWSPTSRLRLMVTESVKNWFYSHVMRATVL
jgi:hypothetical protein